jgi:hypothetical protein
MNRTPATAMHAAHLAANLAKAFAAAVDLAPSPALRQASAGATAAAKAAKIAAEYSTIATSPEGKAAALADAFEAVRKVSALAGSLAA